MMKNGGAEESGRGTLRPDIFTVANLLSAFRILIVPVFLWAMLSHRPAEALLLFCIGGLTDLLDGFAARIWHQRSRLGTILDPAGDKLLMASSFIILTVRSVAVPNHLPLWLTATVFARDLLIVTGALFAYLTWRQSTFLPSFLGKITTGCQVGAIFLVLLSNYRAVVPWYMTWVYWITLLWTLASGIHYFVSGLAALRRHRAPGR